ncbi:MAG TPA: hypothetical protein PKC28_11265 [Bdellovibrionales bacterium]|nr:hypothetical protein [Bdellovibrionales bacterium]
MTDSPIIQAFLRSALLPSVVMAVALLVIGFLKEPFKTRLQGLVLALTFVAGAYLLLGRLNFPPADVSETFSYSALVLAFFLLVSPKPLGPKYLVRGMFVLILGALLLWPIRASVVSPAHHRNLVAFFCLGLGLWSILERSSGRVRPSTLVLLPLIAATGVSLLLLFSASASFSQLVTVLCGMLGALFVLFFVTPKRVSVPAVLPFLSIFVVLFMAAGHFYLDRNPWHMIYLCFPYLILWIREWLSFIPSKPVVEELLLGGIAAAPVAYFVYTAYQSAGPLY